MPIGIPATTGVLIGIVAGANTLPLSKITPVPA
jgi:hypothetical protein